jgi:hypothetical protein
MVPISVNHDGCGRILKLDRIFVLHAHKSRSAILNAGLDLGADGVEITLRVDLG